MFTAMNGDALTVAKNKCNLWEIVKSMTKQQLIAKLKELFGNIVKYVHLMS